MPDARVAASLAPNKSLGQHFLRDAAAARDIAARALAARADAVIEIGPGPGALTTHLVDHAARVVLVEKDERFATALRERYAARPDVTVVVGDATDVDVISFLPPGARAVVVGNLPYNAATPIYFRLLARPQRERLVRLVLMFQLEVAVRLTAPSGSRSYGAPSLATAAFTEARLVRRLPPGAFTPPPKVHSGVVQCDVRATPAVALRDADDEQAFLAFVAGLFRYRRKTVTNALEESGAAPRAVALDGLTALGIDPRCRPETLSLDAMFSLFRRMRQP